MATLEEGILSVETLRGRTALPVPFAVDRRRIIIALAPTNTLAWRVAGGGASLVVTGTAGDRRWQVRATGRAERARADDDEARFFSSPLDRSRSPFDQPPDQLVLTSVVVQGCETRSPLDTADVPLHESASTRSSAQPPGPEFLEMVGRLAASYCPTLLTTEVVDIARAALAGSSNDEMDEVELVARAALDAAVGQVDAWAPDELLPA